MLALHEIVDTEQFPIEELDRPKGQSMLGEWQRQYRDHGACVLDRFVSPGALTEMVREANELAALAFHNTVSGNAYLEPACDDLPEDHPKRYTETTSLGVVACDQFGVASVINSLYRSSSLTDFVRRIVGLDELYFYDCPLGALNLSVMRHGDYLRWHFDQSDFVVSIPLQEAESGGLFEFVKNIRSPANENFAQVRNLLLGDRSGVNVLSAPPGSLVLFQGRHTIHRVTRIEGARPRLYVLLGYAATPHVRSSDYLKRIRYGRTS
jgi:hypothetical protein